MAKPSEVLSFVFFDLEATGLGEGGEAPRITELSLVAVHRASLLGQAPEHEPRVINKLTLCVDPRKPISLTACNITGLYNDALSLHPPFSEKVAEICDLFLSQLPSPVCLLAHNGNKFDFPLLAAELRRVNSSLSDTILCADTLTCLREILSLEEVKMTLPKVSPMPTDRNQNILSTGPKSSPGFKKHRQVNLIKNGKQSLNSDETPAAEKFKQTDLSNAPRKKQAAAELPKEERVIAARRKLVFGSPQPEMRKNDVDDVDMEDVMDSLAGGFRLSKRKPDDDKLPFTSSAANASPPSFGPSEEVPDDVLINILDQYEQSQIKQEQSKTSQTANNTNQVNNSLVQPTSYEPNLSTSKPNFTSENRKDTSSVNESSGTGLASSKNEPLPKTPPNGAQLSKSAYETPSSATKPYLDSFPTPSPSPHKVMELDDEDWPALASPATPASAFGEPKGAGKQTLKKNNVGFPLTLPSIHKHVIGCEPYTSHNAESDSMSLLRIASKLAAWFCPWVDANAGLFSAVTPMYKAAKRTKKN